MTSIFRPSAISSDFGSEGAGLRCCGYYRVSTGRQAEGDLSIPDQTRQIEAFCLARGWELAAGYVEAGASATDDNRPEFQRMIERACDDDRPFDVIVVHSYSRFFRDAFGLEMYIRKLAKAGVRLISITQELGEDPAQVMMRQVIALFDEYQSRENGKHVLRAMKENARQGFYNGSPVPLGYTTLEIEKRGARLKKKLVVDAVEAETVRLVFKLYTAGDGRIGPLGVKQLAVWLNERGYRTKRGGRFGVSAIHTILTNRTYIGEAVFNRRSSKTLRQKPESEQVQIEVPAIVDRMLFDRVQANLRARNPKVTAPRVVTGPILLTGLAACASCSGAMTLRTGTSRSGKVHRYYTCSTCARMGRSACKGRSIAMDKLDTLVTDQLAERLLQPDRLTALLSSILERRVRQAAEVDQRVAALQSDVSEAEEKLKRLYRMVEDGLTELDDILKERIADLKLGRDKAKAALDRITRGQSGARILDPALIDAFSRVMRDNITTGEIPFRKAYIRSLVDRVEVDDNVVRIVGDKATLEQAVAHGALVGNAVRCFEPKWRARKDSNL